ncbi:MAG: GIY-YIG nuclease family protein [Cellvibrionaceae bacterium]
MPTTSPNDPLVSIGKETSLPNDENQKPLQYWVVYIIQTVSGRLYTGITNNMQRRWEAHITGKGGAKFFRRDKPKQLLFQERAENRSTASKREHAIKQLTRQQKFLLIKTQSPLQIL